MKPQLKMMWMGTRVDRVGSGEARVVGVRRQQAIALVLVLAFLVLLSGLILAFFFSVTNARSTAGQFAHEVDAKLLADAAVNIVQGQIRDATRGQDASTSSLIAWASQPGMIHTFDSAGTAKQMFKLYSADSMVVDAAGFTPDFSLLPADWTPAKYDALYADLNEPVTNAAGTLDYPIAAPPSLATDGSGSPLIDGYAISNAPGYSTGKADGPLNNPAPMPVKWLYLMQDGSLSAGVATPQNTNAVTVANASSTNPIIGRLAFWADDETAKVNINTASEGNYWDTPHIYSPEDYGSLSSTSTASAIGMAVCQPAQREFQRYPGHPATTSLSPIFGKQKLPVPDLGVTMNANTAATDFPPYFNIAPRVVGGGSTGDSLAGTRVPANVLTKDSDRLYASIDELMFTPLLSGSDRARNTAPQNTPGFITRDMLEKSKFFLTANSNAPETTLYNTPRVAIWPVGFDPTQQTVYDKLIAFCATVGHTNPYPFYFTRSKSRDVTVDYTQNPRNGDLYKYLQKLTGQNVPGYGGSFLSKYGAGPTGITDRDQILTSIYDYIRCTNLSDTSTSASVPFTPPFNGTDINSDTVARGAGEVLPIQINGTQGFGRFYTISGADLMFCASKPPAAIPPATVPPPNAPPAEMQAIFLLEFASPMQGNEGMRSNLKYTVSGLDQLQVQFKTAAGVNIVNPTPAVFSTGGSNAIDAADFQTFAGRGLGGNEGLVMGLAVGVYRTPLKLLGNKGGNSSDSQPPAYPFYVNITIPPTAATFQIQQIPQGPNSDIVVQIQDAKTNALAQTVHLKFPLSGSFPVPGYVKPYNQRGVLSSLPFPMVVSQDVVAGLEVGGSSQTKNATATDDTDHTAGDIRMVAALQNVPAGMFRAHKNYLSPPSPGHFAYGAPNSCGEVALTPNTNGGYFLGATFGTLVTPPTGMNFPIYTPGKVYVHQPAVPSRVGTFVTRADGITPGDWDTGWGTEKDGAYINKPDEGDGIVKNASDGTVRLPYTSGAGTQGSTPGPVLFSPNRIMPSPLMFGSIPTGVQRNQPWQSLLFNPKPEDPTHPGLGQPGVVPADYLLADLFWMPVVEPYAISQPFSTAGKINLNYQIQPFTYIQRETGLMAVMKATKFLAIPVSDQSTYKPFASNNLSYNGQVNRRVAIDAASTCRYFIDPKFARNEVFKSATEICSINLVPLGYTATSAADMARYWNNNKLTGNNLRDKPYVDLYPRLTTKSNTFDVHVRVQSILKARNTPPNQWVNGKDQVAAEYRGSSIVERYIDVNDPKLPDFATLAASDSKANIDQYYKMRVVSTRRFSP